MCAYFSCTLDIFRTAGTVKKPTEIFFSNYYLPAKKLRDIQWYLFGLEHIKFEILSTNHIVSV